MRRIFTSSISIGCLMAISFNSFGQCTFSTVAPAGAPGAQNTFTTNAEGFTGQVSFNSGTLLTTTGAGTRTITTPVLFLQNGVTQIITRFTLDRTASHDITAYSITATTASGTVTLCPTTTLTPSISPNSPTIYYITTPTTGLSFQTNFQLNIILTQTGSFNFDNFGTTASPAAGALPVRFTSFEAKSVTGGVNLIWNVDVEEKVIGYDVERSSDGRNFAKIAFVPAAGQNTYSYVDTRPAQSATYYRVKAVDVDTKYKYTTIVSMRGGKSSVVLRGFPMPAVRDITIQHATAASGSRISLNSEDGRTIQIINPNIGTQQTVVDLSSVKPGLYFVRFNNGNGVVETLKVVKQ